MSKVALQPGLFEETEAGPALLASRCRTCGQLLFPARPTCLNCTGTDVEPVRLSRDGTLYTYTTVSLPSEHFPPPYAIGWVELPEGVRVFSQLRGWEERPLKTGMAMRLFLETLWQEDDREVTGYVFRPVGEAE